MAYDEELADWVRQQVEQEPGLTEKQMFGGLAFLIDGHMSVAVSHQGGLMIRVPPQDTDALLQEPHTRPMVMRGREMDGWLRVDTGEQSEDEFARWVRRGVAYARSLPPK